MTGFRAFLKWAALFFGIALLGFLAVLVGMRWFIGGSSLVVPDLVGRDMVYAVDVLSRMNLRLKIDGEEYHPHLPANYVISQEPLPGTAVKKGRSIAVRVSKGAHEVAVPTVTGMSQREAEIALQQSGFRIGDVARVFSEQVERGKVVVQNPSSELSLNRGGSVSLLVSTGPQTQVLAMPALGEMTIGEAEHLLEKLGLKVGTLNYSQGNREGIVTWQKPQAGTPVKAGDVVDLVVMVMARQPVKEKQNKPEKTR
ncbi:MAG: PASTA domain-containing protein [Nitrospirota bacterium]|nr:PASTA domain-containing protein [Nitrospirota bacterium]